MNMTGIQCLVVLPFFRGRGRGGAGRDLSEVDDSSKFVLFFFTVKNPEYKSPQVRYRS